MPSANCGYGRTETPRPDTCSPARRVRNFPSKSCRRGAARSEVPCRQQVAYPTARARPATQHIVAQRQTGIRKFHVCIGHGVVAGSSLVTGKETLNLGQILVSAYIRENRGLTRATLSFRVTGQGPRRVAGYPRRRTQYLGEIRAVG